MFATADPTRSIGEPSAFAPCVAQIKQLAALMIELYSNMTGSPNGTTRDVDGTVYYGKGYEDSDLRIPSMRLVKEQVDKHPACAPTTLSAVLLLGRILTLFAVHTVGVGTRNNAAGRDGEDDEGVHRKIQGQTRGETRGRG